MVALLETDVTARKNSFLGRPAAPLGLRIVSAEQAGHVVRLAAGKCTIGSAPGCTLRLRGRGFQPLHCLILRGPGGTAVRRWSGDTRLNGGQFLSTLLKVGDRLALGHVEFEVVELTEETVFEAPAEQPAFNPPVDSANIELIDTLMADKQRLCEELDLARGTQGSQASKIEELTAAIAAELAARESLVQANQEAVAALEQQLAAQSSAAETQRAEWISQRQELESTAEAAQVELQRERELRTITGDQAQTEWASQRQALEAAARDAEASWQSERESLLAATQKVLADWASERETRNEMARELAARSENERTALEAATQKALADLASEREAREMAARDSAVQWESERAMLEAASQEAQALWQGERQGFETSLQNAQVEINQLRQSLASAEQTAVQMPVEDHVTSAALLHLRQDRDAAAARAAALQQRCEEMAASETDLRDEIERLSGAVTSQRTAAQTAMEPKQDLEQIAHLKQVSDELAVREAAFAERVAAVEAREEQINHYVDELTRQQADLENQRITLLEHHAAWKESQAASLSAVAEEQAPEANANTEAEPTERNAPADVSSILARFGRPEGAAEPATAEKSVTAPQPVRMPEPVVAETSASRAEADTDEDSIEAYMARLLNRVRGEAETAPAPAPRATPTPPVEPQRKIEMNVPAVSDVEEQMPAKSIKPAPLVPRAVVRERTENLAAMRELANQSARGHLETHNKLQWGRTVVEKSIIAGASLACGSALLVTPIFETSVITACGAVVSLGTGIAWTVQALRTYKEGKAAQAAAERRRTGLEPPQASELTGPAAEMTADEAAACEIR